MNPGTAGTAAWEPPEERDRRLAEEPHQTSTASDAGSGSQPRGGTGNQPKRSGSRNRQEPAGTSLRFEPLADFVARALLEPEVTFLLPKLVPDRGRVLVVAPPNAGKTWLALAVAKAACGAGRTVLFVEEEGSTRKLGERLEAMRFLADARFELAHLNGVKLDDARQRRALVERLRGESAPVLVLDPMTSLWNGDENETQAVNRLRGYLDELATANPAALVVVLHHTSKAAANGDGHEINAARGSSVFSGWADVMLNLTHAQGPKGTIALDVKVAKNRDGERGYRANVRIDLASGEVTLDDAADPADDLDHRIIEALKDAPGGMTKNGVTRGVKGQRAAILKRVDALVAEGRLVKAGDVFKLPEGST